MHHSSAYSSVNRSEILRELKQLYLEPDKAKSQSGSWEQLGYNDKLLLVKDICSFLATAPDSMPERFVVATDAIAGDLFRTGRQKQAEDLLLAVLEKAKISGALPYARAHLALADHYQFRLIEDKAINHYETAREIFSLSKADTRLDMLAPLECLALLYEKIGQVRKMSSCYEEIRDICDAATNPYDPRVVYALADLVKSRFIQSNADELEKVALNALRRMNDAEYIGVKAETLMVLGDHYLEKRREKLARTLYTQAKDLLSSPEFTLKLHYPKLLTRLRQRLAQDRLGT
ncbi:MAG: hypothetical protein KDD62_05895 [Bdellovibrionales bacterium]|nr:hypothetical protein [Bdellovibrionales bacterium]